MSDTKWKQDFFADVEPIAMLDPLASVLGAIDENEPIYYTYQESVKFAGHACASVSSAYMMTKLALKALYGDDLPVRGDIEVRFAGDRSEGANGPIGQVIGFLTGAAVETGFHGLGGRYVRCDKFVYDENMQSDGGITALFRRVDTGEEVMVVANPSLIAMSQEEMAYSSLMPKVIHGTATDEEREKFYLYWQGKNRKILLEEHPEAFRVSKKHPQP